MHQSVQPAIAAIPQRREVALGRIDSIQALRGIAACLVASMHCVSSKGGLVHPPDSLLYKVTMVFCAVGGAGVDMFFVISGFIIMLLVFRPREPGPRAARAATFLFRRAARIYPLYWITLCILAGLAWWGHEAVANDQPGLSWPVVLLTTTQIPLQSPAWSLPFELWFYLGTACLMMLPRTFFLSGLALWAAFQCGFVTWYELTGLGPRISVLNQPQVLEFFLGCGAALIAFKHRLSQRQASIALVWAAALFVCGCVICYDRLPLHSLTHLGRLLFWGLSSALVVSAAVDLERQRRLVPPAWLCTLGDHSYSIYLWHFPVMSLFFHLHIWGTVPMPALGQAAIEFTTTLLLASVSYRRIERPSIRWAHRLT